MASVRATGSRSTEQKLQCILDKAGIKGWRLNATDLLGKPDFVFVRKRLVVFVDGCFWHGCLKHCRLPETNRDYWVAKIENNRKRDKKVTKQLRKGGWQVLRLWEHEIKLRPEKVLAKIKTKLFPVKNTDKTT